MKHNAKSIRPFIGAKDFALSCQFYRDFGFQERGVSDDMSYFESLGGVSSIGFYLQAAYVKDWVDNTMLFLEVDNTDHFWSDLQALNLPDKYPNVRVSAVRTMPWGKEGFVHDPSGILWHIGEFARA